MNAGKDKTKALSQALANARTDGKPRFVHMHNDAYWIDKEPPLSSPGEVLEILPNGLMTTVENRNGHAVGSGNSRSDQPRQHRHRPV